MPPADCRWRRKPWPPNRKVFSMLTPKFEIREPLTSAVISRLRSSETVREPLVLFVVKPSTLYEYGLSPGQAEEIDRVWHSYPHLSDDAFVAEHRDEWLRG